MNFAKAYEHVALFLEERHHRFGIAGAFALHAYGLSRATGDLDFVVEHGAQSALLAHLASLGYQLLHASTGYSNHVHPLSSLGRLDFIYVSGSTAQTLFSDAKTFALFPPREVLVPRPEHLVAMKVLAMKNDASRRFQELADIQFLLGLPAVDIELVKTHFERHGLVKDFDELRKALSAS